MDFLCFVILKEVCSKFFLHFVPKVKEEVFPDNRTMRQMEFSLVFIGFFLYSSA